MDVCVVAYGPLQGNLAGFDVDVNLGTYLGMFHYMPMSLCGDFSAVCGCRSNIPELAVLYADQLESIPESGLTIDDFLAIIVRRLS